MLFEADAALQFVGNGLGVAIVPFALAHTSADSWTYPFPSATGSRPSIAEAACRNSYIWEETVDLFSRNPRKSYEVSQIRSKVIGAGWLLGST